MAQRDSTISVPNEPAKPNLDFPLELGAQMRRHGGQVGMDKADNWRQRR
jgi:hypothetical protein